MRLNRPMTVIFPNVWANFQRIKNGRTYNFEIREARQHEERNLIEFMMRYFMRDETCNRAFGIAEDPLAVEEFDHLMQNLVASKYTQVCFDITDPENPKIAAASLVQHLTNKPEPEETSYQSEPITTLMKMFDHISKAKDVFEEFRITHYLGGAGISTDPAYRNMGLASEILLTRDSLCRAFGIPVTVASFTGTASQKMAEKCGYQPFVNIDYEELSTVLNVDIKSEAKYIQVMSKAIKD